MTVMGATRIFVAICLFGVALAANPGEEGYCTPNQSFKADCNSCTCLPDGKNAICTLKACLPAHSHKKRDTPKPGEEGYCVPNTTFKDDCNTCSCLPNGRNAACTLIGCGGTRHIVKKRAAPGQRGYCTPGQTFKQDCNTCTCNADGTHAFCTLKGCIHKRSAPQKQPGQIGYCTPGYSYDMSFYTCYCYDGKRFECSTKGCLPNSFQKREASLPNTPGFTCNPGENFKHECNTCQCGSDGKTAACTFAACPNYSKQKRDAECEDGQRQQQDCNSCNCIKGHWACTRKACPKIKREAACKDGETTKQDCNTCNCIAGQWACTRISCPHSHQHKRDIEDEKNCKEGEVKQNDCNTCRCIPGVGFACTKIGCPKKTKREEPVETEFNGASCAPNDKFTVDCNTCYCNSDGYGYSCTEKLCASSTQT